MLFHIVKFGAEIYKLGISKSHSISDITKYYPKCEVIYTRLCDIEEATSLSLDVFNSSLITKVDTSSWLLDNYTGKPLSGSKHKCFTCEDIQDIIDLLEKSKCEYIIFLKCGWNQYHYRISNNYTDKAAYCTRLYGDFSKYAKYILNADNGKFYYCGEISEVMNLTDVLYLSEVEGKIKLGKENVIWQHPYTAKDYFTIVKYAPEVITTTDYYNWFSQLITTNTKKLYFIIYNKEFKCYSIVTKLGSYTPYITFKANKEEFKAFSENVVFYKSKAPGCAFYSTKDIGISDIVPNKCLQYTVYTQEGELYLGKEVRQTKVFSYWSHEPQKLGKISVAELESLIIGESNV
ncbi:MAG: hypothetical protein AB7G52_15545 [Arcobacter sp.]